MRNQDDQLQIRTLYEEGGYYTHLGSVFTLRYCVTVSRGLYQRGGAEHQQQHPRGLGQRHVHTHPQSKVREAGERGAPAGTLEHRPPAAAALHLPPGGECVRGGVQRSELPRPDTRQEWIHLDHQ